MGPGGGDKREGVLHQARPRPAATAREDAREGRAQALPSESRPLSTSRQKW